MHHHLLIVFGTMIRQLTYHPVFPRNSVAIRQQLLRFALILTLGFTTLYFTNTTVAYYRNFYQIRETGQSMAMIVQRTERTLAGKGTQKSRAKTYHYQAVFQFRNQERTMPVSKDLYENLKPGDPIQVLYGAKQDGFIPANDPADHRQLITPLIFWAVFAGFVGKTGDSVATATGFPENNRVTVYTELPGSLPERPEIS